MEAGVEAAVEAAVEAVVKAAEVRLLAPHIPPEGGSGPSRSRLLAPFVHHSQRQRWRQRRRGRRQATNKAWQLESNAETPEKNGNTGVEEIGIAPGPLGCPTREPGGFSGVANNTGRKLPEYQAEAKAIGLEGPGPVCDQPPLRNRSP